jgi:hypothetical protein
LLFPQKKTPLHGKKTRQPCVFHVGSRSPHSATLHCGLSASATLAPLAGGSRLYTIQAKKSLHYVTLIFTCSVPAQGCFTCHFNTATAPDNKLFFQIVDKNCEVCNKSCKFAL